MAKRGDFNVEIHEVNGEFFVLGSDLCKLSGLPSSTFYARYGNLRKVHATAEQAAVIKRKCPSKQFRVDSVLIRAEEAEIFLSDHKDKLLTTKKANMPASFTLPNCNNEQYYLSGEVSTYLGLNTSLSRRYPNLWKRPLTTSEKVHIIELGILDRMTAQLLFRAVDVEQIFEEFHQLQDGENRNSMSTGCDNSSTSSNSTSSPQRSLSATPNAHSNMSFQTPKTGARRKPLKLKPIVVGEPILCLGLKPRAVTFEEAEGSSTELYYYLSDIHTYIGKENCRFNAQYPLLWRKKFSQEEVQDLGIDIKKPHEVLFRAREVDEVLAGNTMKYQIPMTSDGRLRSFILGNNDERFYLASSVQKAYGIDSLAKSFGNLWRRLITDDDKLRLRKQGLYSASLRAFVVRASEIDEIINGGGARFIGKRCRSGPASLTRRSGGRSVIARRKALRNIRLAKRKNVELRLPKPSSENLLIPNKSTTKCEIEDNVPEQKFCSIFNDVPSKVTGIDDVKKTIMHEVLKMCAQDGRPLTSIDNDGFRSVFQTFLDIGHLMAKISPKQRNTISKVDDILPSYRDARDYVDGSLGARRKNVVEKARSAAQNGGIAVSICNSAKSRNLLFATIHFISADWALESCTIAPIELPDTESGAFIEVEVRKAIGLQCSTNQTEPILTKCENETNDEPDAKRRKTSDADVSTAPTTSHQGDVHFVMNNLFGTHFAAIAQNTQFNVSTSLTRCFVRLLGFLKAKAVYRQEKMGLTNDEIQFVDAELFQRPFDSWKFIQKNDSPTINKILPTLREWTRHFEEVVKQNCGGEQSVQVVIKTLAEEMLNECEITREKHFSNDVFYFALILDPSQKNKIREYLPEKQKRNDLTERFKSTVIDLHNRQGCSLPSVNQKEMDSFFDDDDPIHVDDLEKETITYLCTPTIEFTLNTVVEGSDKEKSEVGKYRNVLEFWQRNERKFPNCAKVARKVFAIPAAVDSDAFSYIFSSQHQADPETLRRESQAKNIADLGVLLSFWE